MPGKRSLAGQPKPTGGGRTRAWGVSYYAYDVDLVLVLLGALATHADTDLVAAAAASGRPAECLPVRMGATGARHGRPASVWARARHPKLQRYCHLIARAHTRLSHSSREAREAALAADKLVPGRAAPQVVLGRCAVRDGDAKGALAAFAEALKRDPRAVEQPLAMHDLALAHWRAGKLTDALATYRVLVPRSTLLPSRERRAQVLLEAAHVAMAVAARAPKGTTRNLEEALAYLREAARDPHQAQRLDVGLSLVLALDRAGRRAQANAVLAEQRGTESWAARDGTDYLGSPAELPALRALALERTQPVQAGQHWQQYLDRLAPSHPFRKAAETRRASLRGPKKKPRRRRPR